MPPVDFSHVRKATQPRAEQTIKFKLFAVDRDNPPELECQSATQINANWFNARLKAEAVEPAFVASSRGVSNADTPAASRRIDVQTFADHVVVGWTGVVDATGQSVLFTSENCAAFLASLGYWAFDEVRDHCKDPRNFTQGAIDAQAVAKK